MARTDCPFCEGATVYLIANTNIETNCEYCVKGIVPRPKNFDPAKEPAEPAESAEPAEPAEPRTLFARLQAGVSRLSRRL